MPSNATSRAPNNPGGQAPYHPPDALSAKVEPVMSWVQRFWLRVSDGLKMDQLWKQFQADARASYRLYSADVDLEADASKPKWKHYLHLTGQFFWAVMEKLSPARRILLLVALVFMFSPVQTALDTQTGTVFMRFDAHFWGAALLLLVLVLEVSDRVVMKRDLQIAKEIQTWLLPAHPPSISGLEIAFHTRPANTVAGDYYDVFPRECSDGSPHTYLMAVADVAGKSIPAALLMATVQASLKTLARTPLSVSELVGKMNEYACTNSQQGRRFTTAFIAEYDPQGRTLTYVNAGHNPPIVRRANGGMERLESGGIPIGILETPAYASATVTLQPGDYVVMFSDGVVEAENARSEEYGEDRLTYNIHMGAAEPPSMLLQRIMGDIDNFVGTAPQHDDVTCMLLKAV
ncbi:MAG: PP2C family protein-serine/threonine phosphatase [Candidatus Korobacteraceae bacterium]